MQIKQINSQLNLLLTQTPVDWCRRSSQCSNGGRCRQKDASFICECSDGWSGRYCDIPRLSCEAAARKRGILMFSTWWRVTAVRVCDQVIDVIFAAKLGLQTDELCHHGGHCVNTGNAHYCKCPVDYTGSYCENQVDHCEDKPCRNGATCRGYVGGYQCDVSLLL